MTSRTLANTERASGSPLRSAGNTGRHLPVVPEEYDATSADESRSNAVGERQLAGFVDQDHMWGESAPPENEAGKSGRKRHAGNRVWRGGCVGLRYPSSYLRVGPQRGAPRDAAVADLERTTLREEVADRGETLFTAWWVGARTSVRCLARASASATRASTRVSPVPGGPWMA